jgi:hypothetical protein
MSTAKKAVDAGALLVLWVMVLASAGCDVTNPGPVQDQFLGDPATQQGMVNGSIRMLAQALDANSGGVALTSGVIAREVLPGGLTNYGLTPLVMGGYVQPGSFGPLFEEAQQARFIAEEAVRRFTEKKASPELLYQAHLWAGYAYRVLGANWCEAVLDGGGIEPGAVYFQKAQQHFTDALGLAATDADRYAALAGRAQARLWLGDFTGAAADAHAVPTAFVFQVGYDATELAMKNSLWESNANLPYRAYSIHFTFQYDYYTQTGDPRAEWVVDPAVKYANGSLQGFGQVPWSNQTKYKDATSSVRLASGKEMRLIEAEVLLTQGRWQEAVDVINAVRTAYVSKKTGAALDAWTASSSDEAWARLKRERSIELWLEDRNFGDQRRWKNQKAPGVFTLPNFEALSPLFSSNPHSECFDIPDSERNANPNVPETTL